MKARPSQLQLGSDVRYSMDTSALRDAVDYLRRDVFQRVWDLLDALAEAGRLLVCEKVREEWDDQAFRDFLSAHRDCVIELPTFAEHFAAFQAVAPGLGIGLTDPDRTKDKADPFVVALALWAEGRQTCALADAVPGNPQCCVVSHEKRVASPYSIPFACAQFRLRHIRMTDLLAQEGYSG